MVFEGQLYQHLSLWIPTPDPFSTFPPDHESSYSPYLAGVWWKDRSPSGRSLVDPPESTMHLSMVGGEVLKHSSLSLSGSCSILNGLTGIRCVCIGLWSPCLSECWLIHGHNEGFLAGPSMGYLHPLGWLTWGECKHIFSIYIYYVIT